jgi:DNA-binding MarR family transcriptional regulator
MAMPESLEPRIFHLLHLSHRAVFRAADKVLSRRFGITAAQHGALMYLAENEGTSMSALAAAISLKGAATSGLVDRMEKNGFVERRAAPTDGRSFELFLSPAGREIITESKALIQNSNSHILEGYSRADRAQFADFLTTITKRANAFAAADSPSDQSFPNQKDNTHD